MSFIRKTGTGVSAFFLTVLLYVIVSIVTFLLTLGSASYIKNSLISTGFYNNIVGSTISLTMAENPATSGSSSNSNDLKLLITPLQQVITPQLIQNGAEPIINGFDSWVQGKTSQPQFNVPTQTIHDQLISKISIYLSDQAEKLPICTGASQIQLPFDPLSASCRPATPINPSDFTNAARNFVDTMPWFNGQPLTMQTIDSSGNLQNNAVWQKIPVFYKWLKYSQFICAILIVIFVIFIIWLKPRKYKALKSVGRIFITAAFLLIATGALFLFYFGKNSVAIGGATSPNQQAFLQSIIDPITQHLSQTLGDYYLYFGAIYAFIGAILFFIGKKYQLAEKHTLLAGSPLLEEPTKIIGSSSESITVSSEKSITNNNNDGNSDSNVKNDKTV